MLLLLACVEPRSSEVVVPAEIEDSAEAPDVEHCGVIAEDETWRAGVRHVVTCDVEVERGTLTVAAAAEVYFSELTGLSVGVAEYEAGLVVDGSLGGITFAGDSDAGWDGLTLGSFATTAAISGLTVRDANDGVIVDGATVTLGGLGVDGAAGSGLTLKNGARFAEGAEGLVITGSGDWTVTAEASTADTLPSTASTYTGNQSDGVWLSGSEIRTEATWEDLGVPYVISENVDVEGSAGEPAILRFGPGASVLVERGLGLRFSKSGDASQLLADGTEEAPVRFDGLGADTSGYWRGIEVYSGASEVQLHHVFIQGAGEEDGAALTVADTDLLTDHVQIASSAGEGVRLKGGARFAAESGALAVVDSMVPISLPAAAVASIPATGLAISENATPVVKITGDTEVRESGAWADPGVPYWVASEVDIDGTADDPAVVEIAGGVTLLFDNDTGLFVGRNGSAGLLASGTAEAPIRMLPWSAYVPGAWSGIAVYDASLDASVRLSHLEIGYGGGSSLKGNVHVEDAAPTLTTVSLHDSSEWGLYVLGDQVPQTTDVTYADNASGTCNVCE